MLRKTWDIARLYLYTTYKDRSALFFGLLLPILFTTILGIGMRGFDPDPQTLWRLDVVDNDQDSISAQLIERIDSDPILEVAVVDSETAAEELEDGSAAAVLVIPAGMSAQLLSGEETLLDFQLDLEQPTAAQVVEQAVLAALYEVSSNLDIADTSMRVAERVDLFEQPGAPSEAAFYQDALDSASAAHSAGAPISVTTTQLTRRAGAEEPQIPIGFQQTSPGVGVMFTMFFIVGGSASILLEREQGTLRRLLTTPVTKSAILGGKLLGVYLTGIIQFSIMVLVGQFLLGVDWGQDPFALALMVASFVFAITSLGMLISALVRTYAQVDALSTLIILPLSALGGAMWPIEIVPAFMQKIALFLPTGWAMRGFHDIITRGLGLQDVLLEAAVLVAFGIFFLAIGVWRFKYE
jgi:ABC-2 type transport system permease protein